MRVLLTILLFFGVTVLAKAQTDGKNVPVESKSGKKLNFSEIKIEGKEAANSFKTLIIKYKKLPSPTPATYTEGGVTYKSFASEKLAITAYYKVKKTCPQKVTYYVHSEVPKPQKILTFRISH